MRRNHICRRDALQRIGSAAVFSAFGGIDCLTPAKAASADEFLVDVLLDEPIGTIRPELYGHFAEHIGGVIYDGVWVGTDSKIPHIDGIRRALVEHMRRLGKTVIRWPGGCFADRYHWRDGIGPRRQRPRRFGRWQEDTEPNWFGTREFIKFCRLTGNEPYVAANVGTGTPEEFQQWVEYCNTPAGRTTLSDERAANGDVQPFAVRYWGVGNESWGCGGKFTPEDYCTEYRKYTEWIPDYGTKLQLIAAGPNRNDTNWTRRFFKKWTDYARAPLHGWAAHYYCGTTGQALEFTTDQWYEMLHKADQMEPLIVDQWAALAEFDRKHSVKLVIDEWGCWHHKGSEINARHLFEQQSCLRDALVAALTLDTFNRHADKVAMANVAQLINCLHSLFLADGDKFVATPNFHVFEMYKSHQGGQSVRVISHAGNNSFRAGGATKEVFRLAGSASRSDKRLTVTLVHTHANRPAAVSVSLRGATPRSAAHTFLTHATLSAHNTFAEPDVVTPHVAAATIDRSIVRCRFPPASVNRLDIVLA